MSGQTGFVIRILAKIGRVKELGKAVALSILSQAVSSGTNFLVVVYLVRMMDKHDFGLYSLGFALMLLFAGFITSSIGVQFVVNVPDQLPVRRAAYAMHHSLAVAILGSILIAMALLLVVISDLLAFGNEDGRTIGLPLAVAAALYSQRDILMRVAYVEKRELVVLVSTMAVTAGIAGVFLYFWFTERRPSVPGALFAIATGQAAGCLAGLVMLRLPIRGVSAEGIRVAFKDAWVGGRWNLLTSAVYSLRTQAHNFVVAPLLGMGALADINAARVLVTPALMAIPPLTQVMLPRLAGKRHTGMSTILKYGKLAIGGLTAFAVLYAILMLVTMPTVLHLALGEDYRHVGALVMAWCLVTVALAVRNGLTLVLEVVRAFPELSVANVLAAAVAVFSAMALSMSFGGLGAIVAMAVAEISLCLVLAWLLRTKVAAQSNAARG